MPRLTFVMAFATVLIGLSSAHGGGMGGMGGGGMGGSMPGGIGGPPIGGGFPMGSAIPMGGGSPTGSGSLLDMISPRGHEMSGEEMSAAVHAMQRDMVGRPTAGLSAALEHDDRGAEVVRGEVIAVSPSDAQLDVARHLRFRILRHDDLDALGISCVTLRAPEGMSTVQALAALRVADPGGSYDYAHVYNPSGSTPATGDPASLPPPVRVKDVTVGMIDGGIEEHHGSLRGVDLEVRSFADGRASPPTVHGTAVASLLVGQARDFSGYLPGASLYAADVFGGTANGGSAVNIARALDWLADNNIAVVNISLTGPPNKLLEAAVRAFLAKGHVLVAAVGNDGPSAPPNYPASYPGVIAVTSVDTTRHLQLDANQDNSGFAAVGVNVRAANLPQGYASFTGTSYAAPAVTASAAMLLPKPDIAGAKSALAELMHASAPLNGYGRNALHLIAPSALMVSAVKSHE
ncbi:MAG: S8 family serine peptidase [Betaproteobacteria bacterium]|nr:S8 family serine peptidase [Betaproteobacteria bacterium]